jgi:cytochrome c556
MRYVGRIVSIAAVAAMASFALYPAAPLNAASGEEIIKARIDFMEEDLGRHWRTLAAFGKGGKGSLADVEKSASALAELAKKIPGHFPKDTGRGNFPDTLTRSLPAIWSDSQGFTKAVQRFANQSANLAQFAKAGDKEAVVDLIGTSGSYNRSKIGCGECHESFRGASVKK